MQEYVQAPSPELARQAAEGILEARAYSKVGDVINAPGFINKLIDKWCQLQDSMSELRETSPFTYALVIIALVALAALLIWHMVWSIRRSNRWVGWEVVDPTVPQGQNPEVALVDAANQALEEGRRIEALSIRFRLALYRHARNHPGVLRPGYTNRECLQAWQNKPELMASMTEVVQLLDRCWYAQQECQADEFAKAWAVLEDKQVE